MENLTLNAFLSPGYGYGSGSGSGYGSGYGYGSGSGYGYGSGDGYGDGSGSGSGYGYGSGDGSGDGSGLKSFCGAQVVYIDGVPTVLTRVRSNIAKGMVINKDLTTRECFVVKQGAIFAHGDTLGAAMAALRDKLFEDLPEEERIAAFVADHDWDKKYPAQDFFDWHHRLTGSCLMGREAFVRDNDLDMAAAYTTREFVELTWRAYGSDVIQKIPAAYGF